MQVCHGKLGPLKRMSEGDWIIHYSPTEIFGSKIPYRYFTAIGRINAGQPYIFAMDNNFIPWRRNITFLEAREVAIEKILGKLSFIHDKRRWGFPFRRGLFEIPLPDFYVITAVMEIILNR